MHTRHAMECQTMLCRHWCLCWSWCDGSLVSQSFRFLWHAVILSPLLIFRLDVLCVGFGTFYMPFFSPHTNISCCSIYLWLCELAVWLVVGLGLLGLGICFWGSLSPVHSLWFLWISPQSRRGNEKLGSDIFLLFFLYFPLTPKCSFLFISDLLVVVERVQNSCTKTDSSKK